MKIDTIKNRIASAERKISKLKGTLERHKNQLNKITNKISKYKIDLNNYDKSNPDIFGTDLYVLLFDYEEKLDDIENGKNKLITLQNDLEKLNNILKVEIEKKDNINNVIPKCVLEYLEHWGSKVKNYLINLANEYIEIYNREYIVTKQELQTIYKQKYVKDEYSGRYIMKQVRMYSDEKIEEILNSNNQYQLRESASNIKSKYIKKFEENQAKSDLIILNKIINYYEIINFEILDKIIKDDIEIKKEMFVNRVSATVGIIKDMKDFSIGYNGEINGIAIGDKAKAKVTTIIAGGYNIQCSHFRVLVHKIKQ